MNHGHQNPGSPDQTLTMKPPLVSSIPPLMDIDPFTKFEFHFPADEPWWDEFDMDTSDNFSCDSLSMCSSESDFEAHEDLNLSFPSTFYHICDTTPVQPEDFPTKEDEICRRSPREEEILIPKLFSTISHVAPKNIYQKRRNSMRRKRQRRRRKKMAAANVEPELRTLYLNLVGVLPATDLVLSPPSTPTTLPKINLSSVNKQMLRRLPDVVYLPVLSSTTTLSVRLVGTLPSVSSRLYRLTSAQSRLLQTRASATCGQKKDGVSRLSALLFLIPEEEEDVEKKMNMEIEDGNKKKFEEEKNNCTTTLRRPFGRHSAVSITYSSLACMPCL